MASDETLADLAPYRGETLVQRLAKLKALRLAQEAPQRVGEDWLASVKESPLAALQAAWGRTGAPLVNNAEQYLKTGGSLGEILSAYGNAAAPSNDLALRGMGVPFRGPMVAPRGADEMTSGENFRPMGDSVAQVVGQALGDPLNLAGLASPVAKGAVAAGRWAAPVAGEMGESYLRGIGALADITPKGPKVSGMVGEEIVPTRAKRRVAGGQSAGQYVGAPPGVDTPQAVAAIVRRYLDGMEAGIEGRNWYKDSSKLIYDRTGRNADRADQLAQNLAIVSQSNSVGGNTAMSLKGHMQHVTGEPIHTGRFPNKQSPEVEQAYAGGANHLGNKRDPFAVQLGVEWNPGRIGRGVNDMHEAELMGYDSKTFGDTSHAFMDEIRARAIKLANERKLGGFDDWDTGTAQAAAWTGNKIRRGDIQPGEGAKHFGDYWDQWLANATHEKTPGAAGHLEGLANAPVELRQAFHADPRGSWTNPETGGDLIYEAMNALPGRTVNTVGRFRDETNPASVARPTVGIDVKTGNLTPGSENMLNAGEGFRAFMDGQNAGAWHMPTRGKASEYSGAILDVPGMNSQKMMSLAGLLEPKNYWLASNPKGVTVIGHPPTDWQGGTKLGSDLGKEVKDLLAGHPDVARVEPVPLRKGYIDYDSKWKLGKGATTNEMLDVVSRSPKMMQALEHDPSVPKLLLGQNAADVEAAAKGFGVAREDLMLARKIFAEAEPGKRFAALKEAAAKGIVPAVLATSALGLAPRDRSD